MTSILYNDLITLISASNLVPEEQYCITDYVTTVAKANYTSAGYKFDIVVTALTNNTLYEYALLMANATETYFDADALLIYNIKYNVNNIIPGYDNDWVDADGKGCIYYMVDNKGNEAPYDFKNIKYNGKFLFNNTLDGTDTSQTVSEYNVVKEVIEDGVFIIPLVSFNDECHNVSIDTNASQVTITECSNLQIGDNCKNSEITNVNNTLIGNELSDATLTSIDGAEIGDNNNNIIATNQTNLIIKDNNTSIELGGGNGVIIDSNNTDVIIGTNAKDVYINDSKTINLGNNVEQFNISSCYDVVVADDCKLFTLNETNHLTSETLCNSITCNYNDYVTLKNGIENVYVTEDVDNIILDGIYISSDEYKIIQYDQYLSIIILYPNDETSILEYDGTVSVNPNTFINDSPSDGFIYGRKHGYWEKIDAYTQTEIDTKLENIEHNNILNRNGDLNFLHVNEEEKALITSTAVIVSGHTEAIEDLEDNKANTSHTHTKSEVGLANVDNTSDINKPISTATQTALNNKANTVHTHNANAITSGDLSLDRLSNMKKYVASRGENLVTNGTGLLKDNTNFSSMTFTGAESYNCDGSFTTASGSWILTDESMPINPDLSYRLLYYIKAKPWVDSGVLAGVACFDTDGLEILPHMTMYVTNTLTTLSEDLKDGDTTVKFTNLTNNWVNVASVGTHTRTLIFWNYVNSYGKSYPELTYSRNTFQNSWDPGSVNYATNTITLNKPWSNGTIVAGTKVSNGNSGGTYKYLATYNYKPTTEWTVQSDIISGIDHSGNNYLKSFHPGTASIRLVFGLNRNVTGGQHYISNISFSVDTVTTNAFASHISSNLHLTEGQRTKLEGIAAGAEVNVNADWNATTGDAQILNKPNTLGGYGITDAYTKTATDTAINAIEVGGRNLIPNTKDLTGYPYRTSDTYLGFNIARTTKGATGYLDTFATITPDIAVGSTYVASFYAKASVNTPMNCHWYSPNTTTSALTSTGYASTSTDGSAIIQVTTEWKKYWVVWTQTLTELPKRLIIGRNATIAGAVLEIAGVKLEKGNKATDWTPALEDQVTDAVTETIPITWSNLRTLRNAGTLATGQSYRITDYVCRTNFSNSWAFNEGLFDIIVTALSSNKLSENASATYHAGDTYFSSNNAKLESWELKYCLDNDTTRFDWADTTNGKGVIYYMKDEWNNECPYNFKSIKFKKSDVWLYTFGGTTDDSLTGNSTGNTIKESILSNKLSLNFNTLGKYCYSNKFGNNCRSNTLGDYCYSNTFGDYCTSNILIYDCGLNTFGNNCYSNEFGNECNSNTFGHSCDSNTFGYDCGLNTFGDYCSSNTFVDENNSNTFGDYCSSNTFGDRCGGNTFVYFCTSNTFGDYCQSNTFGNACSSNNFYHGLNGTTTKNCIKFIVLEDGCSNNNFYSTLTTSYTSFLQRIRIKGLEHADPTNTIITLSTANTNYEWVINRTSDGTIKQYCIDDYLNSLYEKYQTITTANGILLNPDIRLYYLDNTGGSNITVNLNSSYITQLSGKDKFYSFELMIDEPDTAHVITFGTGIELLNADTIFLMKNKRNLLVFRTFNGTNYIVNYQGYVNKTTL